MEYLKSWRPEKWDKEADVIVVGYGGAGKITAITAHDLGAKVLILEKAPENEAGGNSLANAGGLFFTRDPEKTFNHLKILNWGATPDDVIQVFVEGCAKLEEYLKSMGAEITDVRVAPEFPEIGNSESILWGSIGCGLVFEKLFGSHVKKRRIEVLYETPGKKLIQNPKTKEILGVESEYKGSKMYIKAKKAVVLCTGGFQANEEMRLNFLPAPIEPTGTPYNTGDGIYMAAAAGAKLWHMVYFAGLMRVFKLPGYEYNAFIMPPDGLRYIWVNKHGKRFVNERGFPRHGFELREAFLHFDADKVEYPNIPSWVIFDEPVRKLGPLCEKYDPSRRMNRGWAVVRGYQWSDDNSEEIQKGWILKADTIKDLAKKIDVDPSTLENTVKKYNEYCRAEHDPECHRPGDKMGLIDTPPYYAMKQWPAMFNTQGGPKRNAKSQVLDKSDNPIPRLYAAGELGSICGFIYQSSENMAEVYVFGQIAGQNATKESSWT